MVKDLLVRLDNAARARGDRPMTKKDWDLIDQALNEADRRLHPLSEIIAELDQADRMPADVAADVEAAWSAWEDVV